jgi:hypothetical protein
MIAPEVPKRRERVARGGCRRRATTGCGSGAAASFRPPALRAQTIWRQFGVISAPFRRHFGAISASFRRHFGVISAHRASRSGDLSRFRVTAAHLALRSGDMAPRRCARALRVSSPRRGPQRPPPARTRPQQVVRYAGSRRDKGHNAPPQRPRRPEQSRKAPFCSKVPGDPDASGRGRGCNRGTFVKGGRVTALTGPRSGRPAPRQRWHLHCRDGGSRGGGSSQARVVAGRRDGPWHGGGGRAQRCGVGGEAW